MVVFLFFHKLLMKNQNMIKFVSINQKPTAMNEELDFLFEEANEKMGKSITHLEKELGKIRAGKANPQMLESVKVDYYGVMTPLSQMSNINTPDPRSIIVQPWEKNMLEPVERAIMAANLGFNPQNDGTLIRIVVPPLTEERRKDLVKKVKSEAESTKVSIRNIRREAIDSAKKLEKEGAPEDLVKILEHNVQEITNEHTDKVDKMVEAKEKDIMTI